MKNIIATIEVLDSDLCELQCYHQPNCVSINFNVIPNSKGLHKCELNNATHRSHDGKLVNREHYVYKGAEVRNINLLLSFTEKRNKHWNHGLCRYLEDWRSVTGMSLCSVRIHARFDSYLSSGYICVSVQCLPGSGPSYMSIHIWFTPSSFLSYRNFSLTLPFRCIFCPAYSIYFAVVIVFVIIGNSVNKTQITFQVVQQEH